MIRNIVDKVAISAIPGILAGMMVILFSIGYMDDMHREFKGLASALVIAVIIVFAIIPGFIAQVVSLFNQPGRANYLRLGIIQTAAGSAFAVVLAYVAVASRVGELEYSRFNWRDPRVAIAGCVIFLIRGIYLIINYKRLNGYRGYPMVNNYEARSAVVNTGVFGRIFTSKVPGAVAGLLVIAGNIINIIGEYDSWRSSFIGAATNALFYILFWIFPAVIGLLASLSFNKPGKLSYSEFGISQVVLGVFLGFLPISIYLHLQYTPRLSHDWYFANIAFAGSLIFIVSGVYLLANNSRLKRQIQY